MRLLTRPDALGGQTGMIRTLVAIAVTLLLAIQVVRSAAVASLSAQHPEAAAKYWSDHPKSQAMLGMTQIAAAANKRATPPNSAFSLLQSAARHEPLAPEPFMVRGVQAQLAGDEAIAQKAFEAAQFRDPRSEQAAYFLAEHYLRSGDVNNGLQQLALLARLSAEGPRVIAPYLASYAARPANWPALRQLFRANPHLAEPALVALASSAPAAPAVLALADPRESMGSKRWFPILLATLTGAGDYDRARAIWAKATGVPGGELLHDASFADKNSPPPFNWELTSSAVGLAERQPGGRLHTLYYGQQDGILATQLLLLPSGSYRLSMQVLGDKTGANALNWSIWCDKAAAPISAVTLDKAAAGWRFAVPAGCKAQWLKLSGSSSDLPQQLDTTIANLKLDRLGSGA